MARDNKMVAIPTKYKGVIYRSRLEARWAYVLDKLGIEYQYEPRQFALNGTGYMPDFYIPAQDLYMEVKGVMEEKDELKIKEFSKIKNILVVGNFKVAADWEEMFGYMRVGAYEASWHGSVLKPMTLYYTDFNEDIYAPVTDGEMGFIAPYWAGTYNKGLTYKIYQEAAKKMDWEPIEEVKVETAKESFKPKKESREKRTARFQLVTTPTLRDMVDKRAKNAKVSRNEFIIQALEYVLSL